MSSVLKNPFSSVPANSLGDPAQRGNPNPQQTPNSGGKQIPKSGMQPDDQTNIVDDNNLDPNNKNKEGNDPLMQFDKLWENEPEDPKNPKPKEPTSFLPVIDPKKLGEMVGKMDFTKSVTSEQLAKITAGGEDATKVLLDVINNVGRQAVTVAFHSSTRLAEKGISNAQERFFERVPSHVKDVMISNGLSNSSAIMKNPAYAPLVEGVRARFQARYPKASPGQLETAVNRYFTDMAADITGAAKSKDNVELDNVSKLRKGSADADWENWLENELKDKSQTGSEITL